MNRLVAILCVIPFFFGCEKEIETSTNEPSTIDVPDDFEIDLNQNGIIDLEVIYEQQSVIAPIDPDPGSFEMISAKLLSRNGCQILKNEDEISFLFFNDINKVQDKPKLPLYWEENKDEHQSVFATISQEIFSKIWEEEWIIKTEKVKDSYMIGFKLQESSENIGFIELSIDNKTGLIEILNVTFI